MTMPASRSSPEPTVESGDDLPIRLDQTIARPAADRRMLERLGRAAEDGKRQDIEARYRVESLGGDGHARFLEDIRRVFLVGKSGAGVPRDNH